MGRFLLIVVAGYAIVLGTMRANLQRVSNSAAEEMTHRYGQQVARNIANSACSRALNELWVNPSWTAGYPAVDCFGGDYTTVIESQATDPSLPGDEFRIVTTSHYGSDSSRVWLHLRRPSFARFAWFTESEAGLAFTTGDLLEGPVHTNGFFTMSGTPVFMSTVSSAQLAPPPATNPWAGSGTPEFHADTEFGRPPITLPMSTDGLEALAASSGKTYDKDVWIQLGRPLMATAVDSFLVWYEHGDSARTSPGRPAHARDEQWAYKDFVERIIATTGGKTIHLWGKLNGPLTVVSSGNIYVEDNIKYQQDPRTDPASDDILGLVAKDSVIVAWDYTAPSGDPNNSDCEIHATVMALKSFTAQKYFLGGNRGTITVLGGIIQRTRGQISITPPFNGYNKDYIYDRRLKTELPPAFPLYGEDQILSWNE